MPGVDDWLNLPEVLILSALCFTEATARPFGDVELVTAKSRVKIKEFEVVRSDNGAVYLSFGAYGMHNIAAGGLLKHAENSYIIYHGPPAI